MDKNELELEQNKKHYSDKKLKHKLGKVAKKAGVSVVYAVLLLYYTLQKPEVPNKVRASIVGALGYFILPIDLLPDTFVGIGYVDDLTILVTALYQATSYIDDEVKSKAREKVEAWFGEDVDTSEIDGKIE
ncbi:YkvA family protein [Piscibacillus sp. B03]|uniref:YkvA family protein n=1 Tax=Piscibacillus sp. B03 TaxID=3457430 RepID=UPI003FCEC488